MQALIGQKKVQGQRFLENGRRIPVTLIDVKGNCVIAVKTTEHDHYQAIQLGFSMKKKATRAELGHAKGAKLENAPKFLKEVRIFDDSPLPSVGDILNPTDIFQPGDLVDVSGISKGKGFAGGVKRHGFHGGPKTHGQSDRHRAPGSIGQGTTPGRVYKGKRMAGRMGSDTVTVRNLEIIDVTNDGVLMVKGLVPGIINNLIVIKKTGTDKKFVPLYKEAVEEEAQAETVAESSEEQKVEEPQAEPSSAEATEGQGSSEPVQNKQVEADAAESSTEEAKDEAASVASNATSGEPKEEVKDGK